MRKDHFIDCSETVTAEFRFCHEGHSPKGCVNGWMMHPFPVVVWNRRGFGETVYRSPELGVLPRPENSVGYIPASETRQSVTGSPDGLDFTVVGFAFEYHGGANFLNRFQIESPLPPEAQENLRKILSEIARSEQSGEPFYRKQVVRKKIGYAVLDILLGCATGQREIDGNDWQRLRPVVDFLNQNYRKPFDIDFLLHKTHLSRVHFYRIFRKHFHVAPQEYIIQLRIREAVRLLLESDLSIGEIGAEVGWDDPFYFSKIFKRAIGTSPLNYRRNPGDVN